MAKVGVDLTPELWLVKVKLSFHFLCSFYSTVLTFPGIVWSSFLVVSIQATYVDDS